MYDDGTGLPANLGQEIEGSLETLESVETPAVSLYVNVDVNDLLSEYSEAEVFELLGKLKDLFNAGRTL